MLARLMRGGGTLYVLLAIYFAVNAALRIVLSGSLQLEESRLFFLSQWLEPGYGGQAPLPIWMQYWVSHVLGANALSVILLENLLLFLAYAFVGWAANLVIRNRALSVISVLGLLLLPQVAYELQRDGGASTAALAATAFFLAGLFAMLARGSLFGYVLAGLGIAGGLLASYDFSLLFVAVLLCMLIEPEFRARLANWRIVFTLVVAGTALGVHVLWLRNNFDLVVLQTLDRIPHHAGIDRTSQVIEGLFSLVAALFGFVVPVMLVFWLAFGRRFTQSWTASSPWTRLIARVLLLVLVALVALIVFGGASAIRDRWLVAVFFMLPLYLALKVDSLNQTIANAPNRFGTIALMILVALPLVLAVRVPAAHWTGRYTEINAPHKAAIEAILAAGRQQPSLILAEDAALAGNIRLGTTIPVAAPWSTFLEKGYRFDENHPLLMVWRGGGADDTPMPEPLARLLAAQVEAGGVNPAPQTIALPYRYGRNGDAYRYGYAWIYPPAP
jgi:4-amino-4-deoxy-L-arabinose transferase-like glycosyltransferase